MIHIHRTYTASCSKCNIPFMLAPVNDVDVLRHKLVMCGWIVRNYHGDADFNTYCSKMR